MQNHSCPIPTSFDSNLMHSVPLYLSLSLPSRKLRTLSHPPFRPSLPPIQATPSGPNLRLPLDSTQCSPSSLLFTASILPGRIAFPTPPPSRISSPHHVRPSLLTCLSLAKTSSVRTRDKCQRFARTRWSHNDEPETIRGHPPPCKARPPFLRPLPPCLSPAFSLRLFRPTGSSLPRFPSCPSLLSRSTTPPLPPRTSPPSPPSSSPLHSGRSPPSPPHCRGSPTLRPNTAPAGNGRGEPLPRRGLSRDCSLEGGVPTWAVGEDGALRMRCVTWWACRPRIWTR